MPAPPFLAPADEPRTYTGICRCKANKFTIELPKLEASMSCNCSICTVHQVLWTFGTPAKFEREGPYIEYEWLEGKYTFNFCATCSNLVKGSMKADGSGAINLRLLQDVDLGNFPVAAKWDGAALPPPYKPAEITGPPFTGDASDKKEIYYGNCHCGACTLAVRSKPLTEVEVVECNCAYCWKDARVHIYPSSEDVHIGGAENLQIYYSNTQGGGAFCKKCGVAMLDADPTGAVTKDGKQIPNAKDTLGHDFRIYAVNVRVLRDVPWDKLKIEKYDGRAKDPQFVAD